MLLHHSPEAVLHYGYPNKLHTDKSGFFYLIIRTDKMHWKSEGDLLFWHDFSILHEVEWMCVASRWKGHDRQEKEKNGETGGNAGEIAGLPETVG
jgi:hypothetical protein